MKLQASSIKSLAIATIATLSIIGQVCTANAASMIGYWEGWNQPTLGNVSSNYDIINVAFALPGGTDNATITFAQQSESDSQFRADINAKKAAGKKIILSIGGASAANCRLLNQTDINSFVNSVEGIVDSYGFNGVDIDFENGTLNLNAGDNDVTNPTTATVKNLITALKTIQAHEGSTFLLTSAPETVDVDAYGSYGGETGSYLPMIYALRGTSQKVWTQCYNSGSQYARNGAVYNEGTVDFDVSQADLFLRGYPMHNGQTFPALPATQVAFGVPATSGAADGASYMAPSTILAIAKYIGSGTSAGGGYQLGASYPSFGGVMTWSISYDSGAGYALANTLHPYLASIGGGTTGSTTGGTTGTTGTISNGAHTLAPQCATGSRLDDTGGSTTNGNHLQIWAASGGPNQSWTFTSLGSSKYTLQVNGAHCLDSGGTTTNGSPATIWACQSGNTNQQWTATSVSGGFTFKAGNSGLCLDVAAAGSANGTAVQTYTCNGTNAQTWAVQ